PNVTRALGVSGMRRLNALAERTGVEVALHGVGTSIGVSAALHCCAGLDKLTLFERNHLLNPMRDDVGVALTVNKQGTILPPAGAGHGGKPHAAEGRVVHDLAVQRVLGLSEPQADEMAR